MEASWASAAPQLDLEEGCRWLPDCSFAAKAMKAPVEKRHQVEQHHLAARDKKDIYSSGVENKKKIGRDRNPNEKMAYTCAKTYVEMDQRQKALRVVDSFLYISAPRC